MRLKERTSEVGPREVGVSEVHVQPLDADQARISKVRPSEIRIRELDIRKGRSFQIRIAEVSAAKLKDWTGRFIRRAYQTALGQKLEDNSLSRSIEGPECSQCSRGCDRCGWRPSIAFYNILSRIKAVIDVR